MLDIIRMRWIDRSGPKYWNILLFSARSLTATGDGELR